MGKIYVTNKTYSALHVIIVGPDGGRAIITNLRPGTSSVFNNCPEYIFAIMAFTTESSPENRTLQHLGSVRPNLSVYEIYPNQGQQDSARELENKDKLDSVNYELGKLD